LHAASRGNHCEVAQAIVRHGGDVNVRGHSGNTSLHVATSAGHLDIARWLLHHGATVNAQDDDGLNPLQSLVLEARLGKPAHSHLSDNVFPKVRDYHGGTSDQGSRQRARSVEVARLLLEHGVNVDTKNPTGQTVGEIAWARRHEDIMYQDIANLLQDFSHSAKRSLGSTFECIHCSAYAIHS
jgi:ankyrin repeat protein